MACFLGYLPTEFLLAAVYVLELIAVVILATTHLPAAPVQTGNNMYVLVIAIRGRVLQPALIIPAAGRQLATPAPRFAALQAVNRLLRAAVPLSMEGGLVGVHAVAAAKVGHAPILPLRAGEAVVREALHKVVVW